MTTPQIHAAGDTASPPPVSPTNLRTVMHLVDAAGGTVRAGAVAKRLGVPVAMVEQLRQAGRLLALPDARGYSYPSWQFEGRGVLAVYSFLTS